ncbi:bifunctional DNA-binding transcriptional regulator/O6-methylguanine-DNA methyltransferase Ada [Kosakonia radicincitans]|uniref:Regulatory protein of adaptive response n=1 Tax=Kosakonia radicincitans TaxID=283686 RepID=A0AAX2EV70_9ENTR|nr:bifunctional DNA-binding transcriptional regulator/O6-methylguanine-DNA methyltransferase Ada [Kosakonia radicincitans]MDP9568128.1 AraC family transcriptional regulator of adaptative response/methylated-DNA-[protein]-cysteine methyltransferase [Kosakonia oryzae]KDE34694.1 6-O-methylguanine DNA methyltransferase [Kosakonia radicincitans UMEnt01/12]QEM90715.1 bifunctional DNA-binding transcriptional regulator/O6-methylguanine-DNA methyltransferase Ada [Kosakonia radicincitans]SFF05680.1 AraC 
MNETTLLDEQRWQAVLARNPQADGQFVFAVLTTGIFCRPSCRARHALRQNVRFFPDADSAVAAGFRPCKRCQPDKAHPQQQRLDKVATACRLLEQDMPVTLDQLATEVGISPYHFHRLFKSVTGMTPKAWQQAFRARRLRNTLAESDTVTDAVLAAGFPDSSSYYRQADAALGMTARQFRRGGDDADIRYALSDCALGRCLVAESERGICAILLADSDEQLLAELHTIFPHARNVQGDEAMLERVAQVIRRLDRADAPFTLPLDLRGTAFQLQVWQALRELPAGTTISYQRLAQQIGKPGAVRAVASACAANKLAIVIPCHRVVRGDGALSGYRWGIARKAQLLQREAKKEES